MKKVLFVLLFSPALVFGQQILWTTTQVGKLKGSDVNLIPLESVTDKVLDFYDYYDYYFDLSGFSKDGLTEILKKDKRVGNSIQLDSMMVFNKPTAIAYKTNDGSGSIVAVLFIQKDNLDIIIFSNNIERGAINTMDRDLFAKWLKLFWNYGAPQEGPLPADNGEEDSAFNVLSLNNRRFIVRPQIEDSGEQSGMVVVEVSVDREGKVISARAGVRGTTLTSDVLWGKCERAVLDAKLNGVESGPLNQKGVVVFDFKRR